MRAKKQITEDMEIKMKEERNFLKKMRLLEARLGKLQRDVALSLFLNMV